jgi:uncharacterized membrane protein
LDERGPVCRLKLCSGETTVSQVHNASSLATGSADGMHWLMRRNCSVSPRQLMAIYLSLCCLSLAVAGLFWSQGATLVLPFAAVELVAVGLALLVHARHATDRELVSLGQGRLVIEQESAGRLQRCEFARHLVRVDPFLGRDQLVEVRGGGQMVRIGRFLRADLRPVLAREIRTALQD